ncbi:replication initiation protein RepC [Salipiger sp. 1_MG-2023]|uniref:replication initiation protein RepC n=1 Tax=Salipiger sp. 1_MG-2023 TaxID=3062665 RepID=UPI0026E3851D|nr:replication initiation protein RepC [Salipiger sp. 1_MG-2023]MDO6586777.1 replication initiation protein RepC [Salipiger sp. 1_MG-2023]
MTSVGSGFGPHIQPTNQHNLVREPAVENQQAATAETPRPDSPDPQTVLECCKDFTAWAHTVGGPLHSWPDLHRVAGQLHPMIGITAEAWNSAQDRLGTTCPPAKSLTVM